MENEITDNRMIKILSEKTGMEFRIELNGEEKCFRELLGAILEIPPSSIKGIKDSYNNYFTLSSALHSKNINTNSNNYFYVVADNIDTTNICKKNSLSNKNLFPVQNSIYQQSIPLINENNLFYTNNIMNNVHNFGNNFIKNYNIRDYYNLIYFLHGNKLIDSKNFYKLKKCIDINNQDVLHILKPYIEYDNNYNKLIRDLFPILNLDLTIKDKFDNVTNESYIQILKSLKDFFTSENLKELNYLLLIENIDILRAFNSYTKNYNKKYLINSLYMILQKISTKLNSSKTINNSKKRKSKSQNYNKFFSSKKNNIFFNLVQIDKKILEHAKKLRKDIFYLIQYEIDNLTNDEKKQLYTNKFNIELNNKDVELSTISKKKIKNYYSKYVDTNIYKYLNDEEKKLYKNIIEDTKSDDYKELLEIYKNIIKNNKSKNKIELLRNKIINFIKDLPDKDKNNNSDEGESKKDSNEEDNVIKLEEGEKVKSNQNFSSLCSSTYMDVEEQEEQNYDKESDESGVSIRKANRPKKN